MLLLFQKGNFRKINFILEKDFKHNSCRQLLDVGTYFPQNKLNQN
jgi:hypothetical protein